MLSITIDLEDLKSLLNIDKSIEAATKGMAKELGDDIYGHIVQQATENLHSRREVYLENLIVDDKNENVFIITLKEKAMFIEEGQSNHNMLAALLKNAKKSGPGGPYRDIPFNHGGSEAKAVTPAQQNLISTIQTALTQKKISYDKIEHDSAGKAKMGLLHSFNISTGPLKTHHGVGQGQGSIGRPIQGHGGTPHLQGVRVYQREFEHKLTKQKKVGRFIMTFRRASASQEGKGMWDHPGSKAMDFFGEGFKWGLSHFDDTIAPKLMDKIFNSI